MSKHEENFMLAANEMYSFWFENYSLLKIEFSKICSKKKNKTEHINRSIHFKFEIPLKDSLKKNNLLKSFCFGQPPSALSSMKFWISLTFFLDLVSNPVLF